MDGSVQCRHGVPIEMVQTFLNDTALRNQIHGIAEDEGINDIDIDHKFENAVVHVLHEDNCTTEWINDKKKKIRKYFKEDLDLNECLKILVNADEDKDDIITKEKDGCEIVANRLEIEVKKDAEDAEKITFGGDIVDKGLDMEDNKHTEDATCSKIGCGNVTNGLNIVDNKNTEDSSNMYSKTGSENVTNGLNTLNKKSAAENSETGDENVHNIRCSALDSKYTENSSIEMIDSADGPTSEKVSNEQQVTRISKLDEESLIKHHKEETYTIRHDKEHHGLAFILTYGQFDDKNLERPSALRDRREMEAVFKTYGCEVKVPNQVANLTRDETIEFLKEVKEEWEKGEHDILIGSVSSHGEESAEVSLKNKEKKEIRHKIICKDGKMLDTEEELVMKFDGPVGKPKLFFIQACRSRQGKGDALDGMDCGTIVDVLYYEEKHSSKSNITDTPPAPKSGTDNEKTPSINGANGTGTSTTQGSIDAADARPPQLPGNEEPATFDRHYEVLPPPCTTDSLVMFASATGKKAFHHDSGGDSGGWLFLCLKEVLLDTDVFLRQSSEDPMEILELLTLVNNKMAFDLETDCGDDKAPRIEHLEIKVKSHEENKIENESNVQDQEGNTGIELDLNNINAFKAVPCLCHMLSKDLIIRPIPLKKENN